MSVEIDYLMRPGATRKDEFAELSVVETLCDVRTDDDVLVPAGSQGTIVAIWSEGQAFEVEFAEPVVGLATIIRANLRAV